MQRMTKGAEPAESSWRLSEGRSGAKSRRRRAPGRGELNSLFVMAFADALRDILKDERQRAA